MLIQHYYCIRHIYSMGKISSARIAQTGRVSLGTAKAQNSRFLNKVYVVCGNIAFALRRFELRCALTFSQPSCVGFVLGEQDSRRAFAFPGSSHFSRRQTVLTTKAVCERRCSRRDTMQIKAR